MTSPGRRGRLADAATIHVARREITTRARSKPFLILTALVFSLIIGGAVVVRVLDPGGDP